MSFQNTSSQTFFERARREARRYGEDPYVFLRELVQNGRDAQATLIELTATSRDGCDMLVCRDNGHGMSVEEMDRYLLRLYASSKEQRGDMIGFFGVGFWSILLFQPIRIVVESHGAQGSCGFGIDCRDFEIQPFQPAEDRPGVQITLYRDTNPEEDLALITRERLIHYVGHIRPLAPGGILDLFCNGERLNRDFELPDRCGKAFKHKGFDGVIGFGATPSVRLYKGGILIRDLASLEEVIPRRDTATPYSGSCMYPVVALNIEALQVLMDRQKIYEDQALHEAVAWCEKTLFKLHRKLLRDLFPMDLKNSVLSMKNRFQPKKALLILGLLVALTALPLIPAYLSNSPLPTTGPTRGLLPERTAPLDLAFKDYDGPIADSSELPQFNWDFQYQGPPDMIFRMGTFNRYNHQKGLLTQPNIPQGRYPDVVFSNDPQSQIKVSMGVGNGNSVILPTPPDYALDVASVLFNGSPIPVLINQFGEPFLEAPGAGRLVYTVKPGRTPDARSPSQDWDIAWPEPWLSAIEESRNLQPGLAARRLGLLIKDHLVYSKDLDFESVSGEPWTRQILRAGGGDCDVLNGLLVLLMKSAGFETYLSVGLVGKEGLAKRELHAWARYWDEGWRLKDLTITHSNPSIHTSSPRPTTDNPMPFPSSSLPPLEVAPSPAPPTGIPFWYLLAALPPILAFWMVRRRRRNPQTQDPEYIGDLFLDFYSHGAVKDPMNLAYRPIFPLVGDRRPMSLYEVEQVSRKTPIFGGLPSSPLLDLLPRNHPVLDRSQPVTEKLAPLLPGVIWLEDMEMVLNPKPLPPDLQQAQDLIGELDPHFRLHLTPDSHTFFEADLPFKNADLGRRHLFVGQGHPFIRPPGHPHQTDPKLQLFDTVRVLLERTTFYIHSKDGFLIRLGPRLLREAVKT